MSIRTVSDFEKIQTLALRCVFAVFGEVAWRIPALLSSLPAQVFGSSVLAECTHDGLTMGVDGRHNCSTLEGVISS